MRKPWPYLPVLEVYFDACMLILMAELGHIASIKLRVLLFKKINTVELPLFVTPTVCEQQPQTPYVNNIFTSDY